MEKKMNLNGVLGEFYGIGDNEVLLEDYIEKMKKKWIKKGGKIEDIYWRKSEGYNGFLFGGVFLEDINGNKIGGYFRGIIGDNRYFWIYNNWKRGEKVNRKRNNK